ncbi:MAG: sulfite exporter TauE/SafE family protein [Candidatus Heimdallarchaeota archaeon]
MDLVSYLFLIVVAFVIGIIAAALGIGGGLLMVPTLTLLFDVEIHEATGTSLVVIIFTALSGTLAYNRQKRIHYKLGLVYAVVTVPGAIIGALIAAALNASTLKILFGVCMIPVAAKMIVRPKERNFPINENQEGPELQVVELMPSLTRQQYVIGLFLGFIAGMASGLLGIGGGAVAVPALTLVIGLPMHIAVATSAFVMIFTSSAGAIVKIWDKSVAWDFVPPLVFGIIFGAQVGARLVKKIPAERLQQLFGCLLVFVLVRMIFSGLGIL